MSTIGYFWVYLTAAIGHAVILIAAYTAVRRVLDLAARGLQAEQRDLISADQERLLQ